MINNRSTAAAAINNENRHYHHHHHHRHPDDVTGRHQQLLSLTEMLVGRWSDLDKSPRHGGCIYGSLPVLSRDGGTFKCSLCKLEGRGPAIKLGSDTIEASGHVRVLGVILLSDFSLRKPLELLAFSSRTDSSCPAVVRCRVS